MGSKEAEFYIAALSILSTRGETSAWDLRLAIAERTHRKRIDQGIFYVRMDILESTGDVTSEERIASTEEERRLRGNRSMKYYKITNSGIRRRTDLAAETADRPQLNEVPDFIEPVPA